MRASEGREGFEQVKNGKLKGPRGSFSFTFPRGNAKTLAPPTDSPFPAALPASCQLRLLNTLLPSSSGLYLSVPSTQDTLLTSPHQFRPCLPEICLVLMPSRLFALSPEVPGASHYPVMAGLSASNSQSRTQQALSTK